MNEANSYNYYIIDRALGQYEAIHVCSDWLPKLAGWAHIGCLGLLAEICMVQEKHWVEWT